MEKRWILTTAFNISASTEEEKLVTLPPSENGEDEMVRGRRTLLSSIRPDDTIF